MKSILDSRGKIISLIVIVFLLFLIVQTYTSMHIAVTSRPAFESTETRFLHLENACENYGHNITKKGVNVTSRHWLPMQILQRPRLYYSDKYKLLVCGVPKCASTEWRKLLLLLEKEVNAKSPEGISHEYAFTRAFQKRFFWTRFNRTFARDRRLNTYYKIMTVREPLERVVSAYVDKMLPGGTGDLSYSLYSADIHKQYGKNTSKQSDYFGEVASFQEFVDHILDTAASNFLDVHWKPYTDICDPCVIRYDYIAKLETFSQDAVRITEKLGVDTNLLLGAKRKNIDNLQRQWKQKYLKYIRQLSHKDAKRLYEYYKRDYDTFGYPPPQF